jgi:hypothetical protein
MWHGSGERETGRGIKHELRDVLVPLLREVESLSERIQEYDGRMEKIAKEEYPEVSLLQQVKGVITRKRLPRWTSSLFRRSPSACSIAFSSSVTIVDASCISMSQSIRQAFGSSSSCEKHFHLDLLRGSSSLIVMPSMDWRFPQRFTPSELLHDPQFNVPVCLWLARFCASPTTRRGHR